MPFQGDSAVAVALKQVSEQPVPPSRINPAVSPALDAVVLRALAKDPANRFANAGELLAALDAAEADPATPAASDTARFAPVAPPPEEPDDEERRWPWRWILLGLLALALAGLAAWALTRPSEVVVPTVLGEKEDRATELLEERGFDVEVEEFESEQPAGTVVEQDPRAGTEAEEGSTVTLSVSEGLGTARVPDVTGLPEREAVRKLKARGFAVGSRRESSSEVEAGRVIETEPAAGTAIEGGSEVTLVVSEGADLADVPDVVGLSQQIAESQIDGAGLIANVETQDSDSPEGMVIEQDPPAGSEVETDSEVTIVVSTGAGSVLVPDVEGLFRDGAVRVLQNRGLDVTWEEQDTTNPDDDGRVLDQAPAAGARVRAGDTVTLVIGEFTEIVAP